MDGHDRIQLEREDAARVKGRHETESAKLAPLPGDPQAPIGTLTPAALLHLQRTGGNAAVVQLLAEERDTPPRPIRGGGEPLDQATRAKMERSFETDFGSVRVHQDTEAARSAAAFRARAYTVGEDVVLGEATPEPRTIAHELTHVVQQRAGPVDGTSIGGGVRVSDPADRFERAAEATADRVMGGEVAPRVAGGSQGVQRQDEEPEEEEAVETLPLQRQAEAPEEEEEAPVETLPLQRQAEAPEGEPEEEAVETLPLQRQGPEGEEVRSLHRRGPAEPRTDHTRTSAPANTLVAPVWVLQRAPAKPARKVPAAPVEVHTERELAEYIHKALDGTHVIGSLAEIAEVLAHVPEASELASTLAGVTIAGNVAMIVLMYWEIIKAVQTHERMSEAKGRCYGIMWQAMNLADRPAPHLGPYLPKSTLEAGRAAFVRGVAEGRKIAQKPVVRNRILMTVAKEGSEGEWFVLNALWARAVAKESISVRGSFIPWPTPGTHGPTPR
jgi:hypothetical protein